MVARSTLVKQIRDGSEKAFEQLFKESFSNLVAYAYRFLSSRTAAEDIVQTVLADIWIRRATLPEPNNIIAFLRARVRQRAIDLLRHELHNEDLDGGDIKSPQLVTPDSLIERAQLGAAIQAAFGTLPPRARLIAVMRWEDGLTQSDIAAELGLSVRTVNAQLVKAARILREILRRYRAE